MVLSLLFWLTFYHSVCPLLVSHCTNCASLAYLTILSVGGHITGLVWFGLFVHPFSHICNIGHVSYIITIYNTSYNIWTST